MEERARVAYVRAYVWRSDVMGEVLRARKGVRVSVRSAPRVLGSCLLPLPIWVLTHRVFGVECSVYCCIFILVVRNVRAIENDEA